MIKKINHPQTVEHLFSAWQETCIWSALQDIMGDIYAEDAENPDAAMVILGDFCFLAGTPSAELVAFKPTTYKKNYIIMVPENDTWAALIEKNYKDGVAKKLPLCHQKECRELQ